MASSPACNGSVYLCVLNTVTEVITFHAAFPDLYILSGGPIEQVGGRALHCLDDYAQPDALASGRQSPGYDVRTRRPLDRGIGPPSDHLPVHRADQFPGVHDGFAFVTPALMPFRASQCRRPIALRAEELCAAGRALILRRFDHRAICASHPGVNFAGVGPYVTMNPTRELAPRLD